MNAVVNRFEICSWRNLYLYLKLSCFGLLFLHYTGLSVSFSAGNSCSFGMSDLEFFRRRLYKRLTNTLKALKNDIPWFLWGFKPSNLSNSQRFFWQIFLWADYNICTLKIRKRRKVKIWDFTVSDYPRSTCIFPSNSAFWRFLVRKRLELLQALEDIYRIVTGHLESQRGQKAWHCAGSQKLRV